MVVLGIFAVLFYWAGFNILLSVCTWLYYIAALAHLLVLFVFIHISFKVDFMRNMIMPAIFNNVGSEDVIEILDNRGFIGWAFICHLIIMACFLFYTGDAYLFMASVCILFYHRVMYLLVKDNFIKYLNHLGI